MSPETLQLTGTVHEPGIARGFVKRLLAGLPSDLCDDAVLLTSELVSNVVRHGDVPARLEVSVDGHTLRIVVHDSGQTLPQIPDQPVVVSSSAGSGRGLLIVAALAQAWGMTTEPGVLGKGMWFELGPIAKR